MGYSDAHAVREHDGPENLDALRTSTNRGLVWAINEVSDKANTNAAAIASAAQVSNVVGFVRAAMTSTGATIPALPAGAKVMRVLYNITQAFPTSTVLQFGDHSGTSGAAAPSSIDNGGTVTATTVGNKSVDVYATPVGALSVTPSGGAGGSGAGNVVVLYVF